MAVPSVTTNLLLSALTNTESTKLQVAIKGEHDTVAKRKFRITREMAYIAIKMISKRYYFFHFYRHLFNYLSFNQTKRRMASSLWQEYIVENCSFQSRQLISSFHN